MRRAALCSFAMLFGLACDSRLPTGPDGSVPQLVLGEACTESAECTSGVCVGTSAAAGVCSRECLGRRDCPAGENWGCLQPAERSELRVCACSADGEAEVCGDGRDNDCNGRMDDCLACGDRLVVGDDDDHCGGCFIACAADEECHAGICRCAERTDSVCDGTCVSTATDVNHCGACGIACAPGDRCAGGHCTCPTDRPDRCTDGCVDFSSDESHCGACGNTCAPDFECIGGTCACASDRPDRCGDECVDTETDGRHCGACGAACAAGLVCRSGSCECTATTVSDLCEGIGCVDFSSDPANCGGCGDACPAGLVCRDGACACLITAAPDYCGAAGCVSLDTNPDHCGACGNACDAGLVCRAGECACPDSTARLCGGACVSTQSSPVHCGGCGITCRTGETCRSGVCQCAGLVCDDVCVPSGDSNCGGCGVTCGPEQHCSSGTCRCSLSTETGCSDGCHNLSIDPANCGACGNACPAGQTCSGSACRCPTGQTWCADLGRCVDLANDRTSCGTCGNVCPSAQTCGSGTCRCASTSQRYCASVDACVDVTANDAHCGLCDNACASGTACSASLCRCPISGETYCASETSCVDTRTDSDHCGRCDSACPSGTACSASSCRCPVAGETYCAAAAACVDTVTDSAHCGRCNSACPTGASCSASRCECEVPGQTACSIGCADLGSDESSCGACGRSCGAGQECRSGVCGCPGPVSVERRLTSAVHESNHVRMAWATTHVGVVYVDVRAGRENLYFRRLDASGAPAGSEVALTSFVPEPGGSVVAADIVWTGAEWGVVWFQRARVSGSWTDQAVLQRIAEDGTLTAPVATTVSESPDPTTPESLVLLHTPTAGFALLYRRHTAVSSNSLRFRILGDNTAPAPAVEIVADPTSADAVVGPAGTFGVIYTTWSSVYFRRVEADGSIVSAPVLLSSAWAEHPAIAYDGSGYVLAWNDYTTRSAPFQFEYRLMIARGTATTARSTGALVTSPTSLARPFGHTRLAVRDGVALLTWQALGSSGPRIDARRFTVGVTGAPAAIEPPSSLQPLPVVADQRHDIVWTGASTAVLGWADTRWSATEIYDMGLTLSACGEEL